MGHTDLVRDQPVAGELATGLDERQVGRREDHVGLLELVLAELVPIAAHELEAAGAFDDNLTLTAGQDDIDRQLAELTSGSQVDDDLARMKAELGQGSEPTPALEEGKPADQQTQGGQQ